MLAMVANFHPLAALQVFPTTKQPDGYPDAMPLHLAFIQPDQEKFVCTMEKELKQHAELKHWKIVHKAQVPKEAKPIQMVWTL